MNWQMRMRRMATSIPHPDSPEFLFVVTDEIHDVVDDCIIGYTSCLPNL